MIVSGVIAAVQIRSSDSALSGVITAVQIRSSDSASQNTVTAVEWCGDSVRCDSSSSEVI